MKKPRKFIQEHLQNLPNSNHDHRMDFTLSDDRYLELLKDADGGAWLNKIRNEAEDAFKHLDKTELQEVYHRAFPEKAGPIESKQAKAELIQHYVDEMIARDEECPLSKTNRFVMAEATLRDAHQVARYILQLSKNSQGVSTIQPRIKYDSEQQKFYLTLNFEQVSELQNLLASDREVHEGGLSKVIGRGAAPLHADSFYPMVKSFFAEMLRTYQEYYPYHSAQEIEDFDEDDIVRNKLDLTTVDGVPLEGVEVYTKKNAKSKACVVHAHGNACYYELLYDQAEALAKRTNCKVVLFDYRGYGLSSGQVETEDDLYRDGFAYAKHCVDHGAKYVLLDGVSLGGTVAAKVANMLRAYCEQKNLQVHIEHFNSMSFASTYDFVMGKIKEVNLPSGNLSKHGLFRTILAGILTPLTKLILNIAHWAQNPKKEMAAMPDNSYEVVNTKGDAVMGTHASVEYQLRDQCQIEIAALEKQIAAHQQKIADLRHELIMNLNTKSDVRLKDYVLDRLSIEAIFKLSKKMMGQLNDREVDIITYLESEIMQLKQAQLSLQMKQNRLFATPATAKYQDGEAYEATNTHSASIERVSNKNIAATDKQLAFINTHQARNPYGRKDTAECIRMLDNALNMFAKPASRHQQAAHLPIKIESLETLTNEVDRLIKIFAGRSHAIQLARFKKKLFQNEQAAYDFLHEWQPTNASMKHFQSAALSFMKVHSILEERPAKQVRFNV